MRNLEIPAIKNSLLSIRRTYELEGLWKIKDSESRNYKPCEDCLFKDKSQYIRRRETMHKIEIEMDEVEYASELIRLAESNEDMDIITEKNFSGDLTTIELYISLTINVVTVLVPIIKSLIKHKKISSMKIDGQKIEVNNVSQELIEKILMQKMEIEAKAKSKNIDDPK